MSIPATELLDAGIGVPGDATPGMADLPAEAMAEPEDAAEAFDVPQLDIVADAPAEGAVEDPATTELRAQIEADVRSAVTQELQARFEQEFANLRTVKDNEANSLRTALMQAAAKEKIRSDWLTNYFQQNGLDPRDIAVLENHLMQAERQVSAQQQQQQATGQQVIHDLGQRFVWHQQDAQARGLPVLDPNDPEVRQEWGRFATVAQQYGTAAYRAEANREAGMPIDPRDYAAAQQLRAAGETFKAFQDRKRAQLAQEADRKASVAKEQAAARKRQQQRGPQHTAGGGGAPMNADAAWEMAQKEFPDDAEARFKRYMTLKTPQVR